MTAVLCNANALRIPLADESCHMICTSPPYWGLRNYLVEGQLGLEPTIDEYVANMVAVFREVKRVLHPSGTLWLNLGDSYAANRSYQVPDNKWGDVGNTKSSEVPNGLKPKDLCGIPWRVAFALQADGWWLRSDCIWAKPNPMPESVTDRPTKSHEYVFLLTKAANYFYDSDAVREPQVEASFERAKYDRKTDKTNKGRPTGKDRDDGGMDYASGFNALPYTLHPAGRNLRTVWTIATAPYSGAHFATFPPALVERCIRAGTSERGACPVCGKQWERVVERGELISMPGRDTSTTGGKYSNDDQSGWNNDNFKPGHIIEKTTLGWRPTCTADCLSPTDADPIPATVFDPFVGSGTTVAVAQQLGRRGVGIDLSMPYLHLARERTGAAAMSEWIEGAHENARKNGKESILEGLPLFQIEAESE